MWMVTYDEKPYPMEDDGETVNIDALRYRSETCKTKAEADRIGKEKAPDCYFGVANVVEIRRTTLAIIKADDECDLQWFRDADGSYWTEVGQTEEVTA